MGIHCARQRTVRRTHYVKRGSFWEQHVDISLGEFQGHSRPPVVALAWPQPAETWLTFLTYRGPREIHALARPLEFDMSTVGINQPKRPDSGMQACGYGQVVRQDRWQDPRADGAVKLRLTEPLRSVTRIDSGCIQWGS